MTRRWTCLALLIAFSCLSGLHADDLPPSWRPIGPYGAHMTALQVDPKRPGVVFAGTDAGLYRSLNGGTTWQPASQVIGYIGALAAGPSSIYAASDYGGLFESHDGGTSWAHLGYDYGVDGLYIIAMEADPVRSTLFIILSDLVNTPEMLRSTDGGKHWSDVHHLTMPCPTNVAADRGAPGTFYVGTCRGIIFRTTDGGASWKSSNLSQLQYYTLHALAVDPVTHNVYAGGDYGVFLSTNRGVSWRRVLLPPNELGVNALAVRGGVVYAVARTYSYNTPVINELFVSTNGGKTWHVAPQEIGNAAIEALAIDPRKPQTVYIGAHSWGVFKSSDAAAHWTLIHQGLRGAGVNAMALDSSNPGTILAGADGAGLWKTRDGGRTWSLLNASLGSVRSLALDPRHPATIFAVGRGALQRSEDGGAHWTTLTAGLESTFVTGPLSVDPQAPDSVYAVTATGISHSVDGGDTWSAPVPGPQCTWVLALAVSATGTVYLGGTPIPGCFPTEGVAGGVYASTDGGATWKDLRDVARREVYSLAFDPAGLTLYVGGRGGVSFTTDEGATWQATAEVNVTSALALDTGQPATIYAGFLRGGVGLSTDGGATWVHYYAPATKQLAFDAAARIPYAATEVGLYSFATQ
jgi:photosystem II stability/assembly factor-like uncharacterized protein